MQTPQRHIIREQILELLIPSGEDAFRRGQAFSRLYRQEVLPRLDEAFSRLIPSDKVLRIRRLDVDLGAFDPDRFPREFVERCVEAIRREIAGRLDQAVPLDTGDQRIMPSSASDLALLLHFLTTGALPWWRPPRTAGNLEGELGAALPAIGAELAVFFHFLFEGEWLPTATPAAVEALSRALADGDEEGQAGIRQVLDRLRPHREAILRRLTGQFSDAFLEQLIRSFPQGDRPVPIEFIRRPPPELATLFSPALSVGEWRRRTWITALRLAVTPSGKTDEQRAFYELLTPWLVSLSPTPDTDSILAVLRQWTRKATSGSQAPLARHLAPRLLGELENRSLTPAQREAEGSLRREWSTAGRLTAAIQREPGNMPPEPEPKAGEPSISPTGSEAAAPPETLPPNAALPERERPGEAGYYLDNAGLVLLSPYLPRFFETVGLVEKEAFTGRDAQQRAIYLLQYLAGLDGRPAEYELPLNKVLCGWPLEDPLDAPLPFTDEERTEADDLLRAVIRHWTALKNTSPAGLRETFLQREGKLFFQREQSQWRLQVEQKGVDVLLNHVPWTYSVVRLPWMSDRLQVDWA